ncbi:unnamed protein product [Blepharisma stoltei]|uniref:Uncharacterized protein n=1 Tax=Blepharisma stoltei TaxID=1481888 RepID=A0AAU9JKZ7_9CILI|nr:unnamed protein product [Blepharisma stoltei]
MAERYKFCKSRNSIIGASLSNFHLNKRLLLPELPIEMPKRKLSCRSVTFPCIKRDKQKLIISHAKFQQEPLSPASPESPRKLSSSLFGDKLPATIKKEVKVFRIKKRFKNMNDFNKRIPQDDPLECYYENLPYIGDVLQENRAKHYSKMSKLVLPVYEESNESLEVLA